MKRLGPVPDPVTAGTIGTGRPDTEIIMTPNALLMKRIFSAGHHIISHSPLMAHCTGLWSAFIALVIIMMAVIAIQSVLLAMRIVVKYALSPQCRPIFAIRRMTLTAWIRLLFFRPLVGMVAVFTI
jgi:hypothetical protein